MTLRMLAAIACAAAVAVPAASAGPVVTVVSKAPLQLRGAAFGPGVVVTVTVATSDGRMVRKLRTGTLGRFTARFAVAVDPCNGATAATVTTASGYRLALRLAPRGVCAPVQPIDK